MAVDRLEDPIGQLNVQLKVEHPSAGFLKAVSGVPTVFVWARVARVSTGQQDTSM
ncbi:hypothetical protein [Mycolicibacterium mengxianglii]|uniref:hypothetical protein n=1 Tax=Mycolicibacterium mengxianglii TaxID=2736649 RepID=UPI0018D14DF9|nr:hypothetical protein [Mycolicibacterium mengxianglii]